MGKFLNLIGKKYVLLTLFFATLIFNFLLSYFMPKDYALDLKFAYTYWEAIQSLSAMDLNTRNLYRAGIWILDFPYLLIYSSFLIGILVKLYGKQPIIWLPLLVGTVDLFENILETILLNTFPFTSHLLVLFASFFTTCKWILVAGVGLSIIVGVVKLFLFKKHPLHSKSEVEI